MALGSSQWLLITVIIALFVSWLAIPSHLENKHGILTATVAHRTVHKSKPYSLRLDQPPTSSFSNHNSAVAHLPQHVVFHRQGWHSLGTIAKVGCSCFFTTLGAIALYLWRASKHSHRFGGLTAIHSDAPSSVSLHFAVFALQKVKRRRAQRDPAARDVQVEAVDIKLRSMELRDTGPCFYLGDRTFVAGNLYREWDEWEPVSCLSSSPEYCFVAELANGRVVGFVLGSVVHKKSVSIGFIDWVVVDKGFQRLGVGTKLVTKVTTLMRDREGIHLLMADTPSENVPATDFFVQHLGFSEQIPHVYLQRLGFGEKRPLPPAKVDGLPVVLRRVIVDDLFNIYQLGEKVFLNHANLFRAWDENEVMDMFSQNSDMCLVATINDELAGFALGTTVDKRKSKTPYGYLVWLAVDSRFGRRGVGTLLMRAFDERMAHQGCTMMFVDTQADNEAALKFFQSQGFDNPRKHLYMTKPFADDPPGTPDATAPPTPADP